MNPVAKRWWLPGAVGTTLVGLAVFAGVTWIRLPDMPGARAGRVPPAVTLGRIADVDAEERELTDLEPLFLPTRYNMSVLELPAQIRKEPGSMAFVFPPKLTVSESGGGLILPDPISVPAGPLQAVAVGETPNPWPELGRDDVALPTYPKRLAFVEVRHAGTGQVIFSESVEAALEQGGPGGDWAPVEFTVAIDRTGLIGAPAPTRASTSEQAEEFFRTFLARRFNLGARLSPGFYTVLVGP